MKLKFTVCFALIVSVFFQLCMKKSKKELFVMHDLSMLNINCLSKEKLSKSL